MSLLSDVFSGNNSGGSDNSPGGANILSDIFSGRGYDPSTYSGPTQAEINAAPVGPPVLGPLPTDNGLYGGSEAQISQGTAPSWWEQHIARPLQQFFAPTKEDLLAKSGIAPQPFESTDQMLARIGAARAGNPNNDLVGQSIISGLTFGLVRPQSLSEVPLTTDEQHTAMAGQLLGSFGFGPIAEGLSAARDAGVAGEAAGGGNAISKLLKPGANPLVNWVKSGLPSAAANIGAGQLNIGMDNSDASTRIKQGLTDAGFSYAFHLFHLPEDMNTAAAYKEAPALPITSPKQLDLATQHLAETGNFPVAQKDLGNGELGIATQTKEGETKLYKIAADPSMANPPEHVVDPSSPLSDPTAPAPAPDPLLNNDPIAPKIGTPAEAPAAAPVDAAPVAAAPVPMRALGQDVKLPSDLAGATPRYKNITPQFSSDIDKASYIAAQEKPSARNADYVKFVMDNTGMTESQVIAHGQQVKATIAKEASNGASGTIPIGAHEPAIGHDIKLPSQEGGIAAAPEDKTMALDMNRPASVSGDVPPDPSSPAGAAEALPKGQAADGFSQHAATSPDLSTEAQLRIVLGSHDVRNTAQLGAEADALVKSDPVAAHNLAMEGTSDKSTAAAISLIKEYGRQGSEAKAAGNDLVANEAYAKMANIAEIHAENSVKAGRTIQANTLLASSPEGQVARMAREFKVKGDKIASPDKVQRVAGEVQGKMEAGVVNEHGNIAGESTQGAIDTIDKGAKAANATDGEQLAQRIENQTKPVDPKKSNELVDQLYKQIKDDSLPVKGKATPADPLETIKSVYGQTEESKAAFNDAKSILQDKFKDDPKTLAAIEKFSNSEFTKPNADATTKAAVANELKSRQTDLNSIIKQSLADQKTTVDEIAAKMTSEGFSKDAADQFSQEVQDHLEGRINDRKISALQQMQNAAGKNTRLASTLEDKINLLSNKGALTNSDFLDVAKRQLKLPELTPENAATIHDLAQKMQDAKAAGSSDYGINRRMLSNYLTEVRNGNEHSTILQKVADITGVTKSLKTTISLHAVGRVGGKMIFTEPGAFLRGVVSSFQSMIKSFGDKAVLDGVWAELYNNPHYDEAVAHGLAVKDGFHNEDMPSNLPNKIPILSKFFNASNVGFEAFNLRTRMDLYSSWRENSLKAGQVLDTTRLKSIAIVANQLTNRGDIAMKGGELEKVFNAALFSPRAMKSNIDQMTFGILNYGKLDAAGRIQSARYTLQTIVGTAATMYAINLVRPGTVEMDPRSSAVAHIKIGDTSFDPTGGLAGVLTLAAQLATSSSKSSKTGAISQNNTGKFGANTSLQIIENFFTNRASPALSVAKEIMNKQTFAGGTPTFGGELSNLLLPLPLATAQELSKDHNSAPWLAVMLAASLGVTTSTRDQGQSQPGQKGQQASLVQALVAGNKDQINSALSALPKDQQAKALAAASKTAATYQNHQSNQTVDFYSAYNTARTQRDVVSKQVTGLVKSGNINQAARVAQQYNATVPGQFTSYTKNYGAPSGESAKMVKSLEIPTGSLSNRGKTRAPLSFAP